jgi:membrane-bound lytic murein transglycosylase B
MKQLAVFLTALFISGHVAADNELPDVDVFIEEMVTEHQFDRTHLENMFKDVEVK